MIFITLVALIALSASTQAAVLNLTVYYESLCPDSKAFIVTQLDPANDLISEYLNVQFIPFGNAEVLIESGQVINFTCQHGPGECYGNEIQACAISINRANSYDFVVCAMASDDASNDDNLAACAESSDISWDAIKECFDSGLGLQLFIENGLRTVLLTPPINWVPTLVFNGVYDTTLQDSGEYDFLPTACTLLDQEPEACASLKK